MSDEKKFSWSDDDTSNSDTSDSDSEIQIPTMSEEVFNLRLRLRLIQRQLNIKLDYENLNVEELQKMYNENLRKVQDYFYDEQLNNLVDMFNLIRDEDLARKENVYFLFAGLHQLTDGNEKLLDDLIERVQRKDILIKYKNINAQL